jgi:hypothetical protein
MRLCIRSSDHDAIGCRTIAVGSAGHAQYSQIYALITTAMTTGTKIMAYVDQCAPETWYTVSSVTYNYLDPCCSIYASTSN